MLEAIEKLLILQDRDRKILHVREELSRVQPEREALQANISVTQATLESVKGRQKQIEAERKRLELDVVAKKQQIEKYSLQQFQTKKNDEYRALAHEIDTCKGLIVTTEDQQIELMEQAETVQKQVQLSAREAEEAKKVSDGQLKELAQREAALKKELAELESNRQQLTISIEGGALNRYERLLKQKGGNVIVGVTHGVCGGCHMRVPPQAIVSCQAGREIVSCPNCGRILYYTLDMDIAIAD
jgi:predicted  nucleic acid-binding Zn-ribbon protein